jgi:cytochrome c oxidase subunit 1
MPYHVAMAIGGMILFVGVLLMIFNVIALLRAAKGYTEYPIGEVMETAEQTPRILERWGVWVGILFVLILVAYTVPVTEIINDPSPGSKGFVTW